MSIQRFYNQAVQRDFARLFQFRLKSFGNVVFSENHLVYVETAALPGRQINNVSVPYMGLAFNVPGTASYPGSAGYNVTFRCDQDYDIRAALEQATISTFDELNSSGDYSTPNPGSILQMDLMDKGSSSQAPKAVRSYKLFGAYVVSLADAGYDIKDTGTIQTVQATIAYQYWIAYSTATGPKTNRAQYSDTAVSVTPTTWAS